VTGKQPEPNMRRLDAAHLKTHPRNMRRSYPPAAVAEMAASLKACWGNKIAMPVVPADEPGCYYVVDGNLRLAGGRRLGPECPPFKCEIVSDSEAEQLLTMVVANRVRFDPDVISEALHYRRLIDEEGYSVEHIAAATGKHRKTIENSLVWLKLEPAIQELAAQEGLPRDRRVAEALLSVPAGKGRIRLAQRLVETGATIAAIEKASARLKAHAAARAEAGGSGKARLLAIPALEIPAAEELTLPRDEVALTWPTLRGAAAAMCNACDIKVEVLYDKVSEPAWALIAHAATDTCANCSLRLVQTTCNTCPGVEIIRRLMALAEAHPEAAHAQRLESASNP
jgi:ParB/RepB/Spo0J family partition protein